MTMMDYILETETVCLALIAKKERLVQPLLLATQGKEIPQIYLLGSGTSYHAGLATKAFLEKVLKFKVTPMFPLPFKDTENFVNEKSIVIGVSQSGGSVSTMQALDKAKQLGLLTVSLSGELYKDLDKHADVNMFMDCGVEKAVAKTKGYTATLVSLVLIGVELARDRGTITNEEADDYLVRLEKTIRNIPQLITASEDWYNKHKDDWYQAQRVFVTGYQQQYGTMLEGALKMLETVRRSISGLEMEEFMHGAYNAIKADTRLIMITNYGQYQERAYRLADYMRKTTKYCYCIGPETRNENDLVLPLIDDEFFNVIEYVIPFQVLSYRFSVAIGVDPSKSGDPNFHSSMKSKLL